MSHAATAETPAAPASAPFPGRAALVARLDEAVQRPRVEDVTADVQSALVDLLCARAIDLPEAVTRPVEQGYARRLVYRSDRHGYVVIAMTWGPSQGTPLHDHAGVWCVEGVVEGQIDVTQYAFVQKRGDRFRFDAQGTVRATLGSAGCLIPPFEYHTIKNALPGDRSVTLHVYGRELETCTVFEKDDADAGWYQRSTRHLGYAH